jgi:hypothetical protein
VLRLDRRRGEKDIGRRGDVVGTVMFADTEDLEPARRTSGAEAT